MVCFVGLLKTDRLIGRMVLDVGAGKGGGV